MTMQFVHIPNSDDDNRIALFALYREAVKGKIQNDSHSTPNDADVSPSDGGAYVLILRWISDQDLAAKGVEPGDYQSFAHDHLQDEDGADFPDRDSISIDSGGAWLNGWMWVEDEDVMSNLWRNVAPEHQVSTLNHLASSAAKTQRDREAIDAILFEAPTPEEAFNNLCRTFEIDLLTLNAMFQKAADDRLNGNSPQDRPKN